MKGCVIKVVYLRLASVFCLGFFIVTSVVEAQEFRVVESPDAVYQELKKRSDEVRTIRADFREVRHAAYLNAPQVGSGKFAYQKNDRMRWEQTAPRSYIILIHGNSVKISDAGKEKEIAGSRGIANLVKETLLMIVNGEFHSQKGFQKTLYESGSSYRISLEPLERRLKQRYDRLELHFSKKTKGLEQLIFFEKGGDRQILTFTNERVNESIDSSVFSRF